MHGFYDYKVGARKKQKKSDNLRISIRIIGWKMKNRLFLIVRMVLDADRYQEMALGWGLVPTKGSKFTKERY